MGNKWGWVLWTIIIVFDQRWQKNISCLNPNAKNTSSTHKISGWSSWRLSVRSPRFPSSLSPSSLTRMTQRNPMSVRNSSKPAYLTSDFHIFYYLHISEYNLHPTAKTEANCICIRTHDLEFILEPNFAFVDLIRKVRE